MNYLYNIVDKSGGGPEYTKYSDWQDGAPNLQTYLSALNVSNPIASSQYELRMSRWPRTIFFAKNITIPGITTNTLEINHAGFVITLAANPKYESTELSFTVLADKEGFHYYDFRNMVLQSGHPLVAGDTRSMIGFNGKDIEDTLDIRLRNSPNDETHHHWVVRNFRPITIGDIELSHDGEGFVEFEITGTFTHIDYDCGHQDSSSSSSAKTSSGSESTSGSSSNGSSGATPASRSINLNDTLSEQEENIVQPQSNEVDIDDVPQVSETITPIVKPRVGHTIRPIF